MKLTVFCDTERSPKYWAASYYRYMKKMNNDTTISIIFYKDQNKI